MSLIRVDTQHSAHLRNPSKTSTGIDVRTLNYYLKYLKSTPLSVDAVPATLQAPLSLLRPICDAKHEDHCECNALYILSLSKVP